jgi:amidase
MGLATDTAGSIRVPASYQGLWGLRTTHGLVPRQGVLPLAQSFDTVGWLTRDGDTMQRIADWCLSYDGSDSTENVFGAAVRDLPWRFLVPAELLASADEPTRAAFEALLARLETVDAADIGEASIGDPAEFASVFRTVQGAEAWRNHGEWLRAHPGAVGPAIAARFEAASTVTAAEEAEARGILTRLSDALAGHVEHAVLLFPTAPGPAPLVSAPAGEIDRVRAATLRMTTPASVAGLPAVSVPLLTAPGPTGPAPVGVSLVSARGTDVALIRLARRLAAAAAAGGAE